MVRGFVLTTVWVALSVMSLGCEVPPSKCKNDGDCVTANRCDKGICKSRSLFTRDSGPPPCATNQECLDRFGDDPYICRKSSLTCVPLKSDDCQVVLAASDELADDNTVFFGAILPIVGVDESTGKPLMNSIDLARQEFADATGGLPAVTEGGKPRPIAVVGCNDENAEVAADHLVNTLEVPAILGPAFSGVTLNVANNVTIPARTLLFSPSATSTLITSLDDFGLVWRTSPPDSLQVLAVNALVAVFEAQVRSQGLNLEGDKIKVSLGYKGDSYGDGFANELFRQLRFNGGLTVTENGANYAQFNYGDPDDQNPVPSYDEKVAAILAEQPHIVILAGTNEAVTEMFVDLEAGWPAPLPYKIRYIFTDGGKIPELVTRTQGDPQLRNRVLGTVPGTKNTNYDFFKQKFNSSQSSLVYQGTDPEVFGTAGAYDATYLLAYAAGAIGEPLTGTRLVEGLKKLVGGTLVIDVGTNGISAAFGELRSAEGRIDFNGASGPLDFNVDTGEASSDIQIYCVSVDGNGQGRFATTDYYYDAARGAMAEYGQGGDGLPTCP